MNKVETKLAGITFRYKEQPQIRYLKPKPFDKVALVPDPDNKYSKTGKAVKVFYKGYHIGFIPEYPEKVQAWIFDILQNRKIDVIHACFKEVFYTDSSDESGNPIFNKEEQGEFHGASLYVALVDDLIIKGSDTKAEQLKSFTEPEKAFYVIDKHIFHNDKQMLSASSFLKQYIKEFDAERIAKNCEKKYEMDAEDIVNMWDMNGDVSTMFGSAIHKGLEYAISYYNKGMHIMEVSNKKMNPALPKIKVLNDIITQFIDEYIDFEHEYNTEVFITDSKQNTCGFIDLLEFIDDKTVNIIDYKITGEPIDYVSNKHKLLPPFSKMEPSKKTHYTIQLNFYRKIVENFGYKVNKMIAFNYTDVWCPYELERIDLEL